MRSVAFITNIYAPYKEVFLSELSRLVDLHVFYSAETESHRDWSVAWTGGYTFTVLKGMTLSLRSYHYHINPGIVAAIRGGPWDAVVVGGYQDWTLQVGALTAMRRRMPTILWSGAVASGRPKWRNVFTPLKRLWVRQFDHCVSYSSYSREYLEHLGVPPSNITVAHVSVDNSLFSDTVSKFERGTESRHRLRTSLGCQPGDIVICFVGQLVNRKGLDLLLKALAGIADQRLRLLVAGDGRESSSLKALAADLGIAGRVNWLGHLQQSRVAEVYASSDLFVLPSRNDQSGNVVNEAVASGLPVIVSDCVGTDLVEHNTNGLRVPPGDVEGLKRALIGLTADNVERERLGAAAKQQIQRFSPSDQAACFAQAIEKAITSSRS